MAATVCRAAAPPEAAEDDRFKVQPEFTKLPVKMNCTPQSKTARQFFYSDTAAGVLRAITAGHSRIQVRCTVPETNPEMDVFRIGTLLELVREVAVQLAGDGKRTRICVQGSMGQGVFQGLPLSLSGVAKIMEMMDWGDAGEHVGFGKVSAEDGAADADVFVLVAPQNVVGNTIMTNLQDMVRVAEAAGKQVVLVNPQLNDIPSHSGVMGVRGREERISFAASFVWAYHFRLLYYYGQWYPIIGALRYSYGGRWQTYKRVSLTRTQEEYQLWGDFESEPGGGLISSNLKEPKSLSGREKQARDKAQAASQAAQARPQRPAFQGWKFW